MQGLFCFFTITHHKVLVTVSVNIPEPARKCYRAELTLKTSQTPEGVRPHVKTNTEGVFCSQCTCV